MNINFKRKLPLSIGLAVAIIVCWYFLFPDNTGEFEEIRDVDAQRKTSEVIMPPINESQLGVTEEQTGERSLRDKTWSELYKSPINFWGKVVDENGSPIAGATIHVILYDDPTAGYSDRKDTTFETTSGLNGNFSILGKLGGAISVEATLSGYRPYYDPKTREERSSVRVYYFGKPAHPKVSSTKTEPTLLILQKKNSSSNLIHIERTRQAITGKGDSLNIQLEKKGSIIDMKLRCFSSAPHPFNYEKYDWEAEVEIIGGSIQEVKDIRSQVAPRNGYKKVFKLKMSANAPKWSRSSPSNKQYFWVKLDRGGYAKAQIRFVTGRKHLVYAQAWINTDGNDFVIER